MTTDASTLAGHLRFVQKGVGPAALGIHSEALFCRRDGTLSVRSFNGICHSVAVLGPDEGPDFSLVASLPALIDGLAAEKSEVALTLCEASSFVLLSGRRLNMEHAATGATDDFVEEPAASGELTPITDTEAFLAAFAKASVSVDATSVYDQMRGVRIDVGDDGAHFVGTNGATLSRWTIPVESATGLRSATVPAETAPRILSLVKGGSGGAILITDDAIVVRSGSRTISSILLQSKFPNYLPVLLDPTGAERAVLDKAMLMQALKIGEQYASEYHEVFMDFQPEGILVISSGMSARGRSRYTLEYGGQDAIERRLKMSAKNVARLLSAITTEKVEIMIPDEATPQRIALQESEGATGQCIAVLMQEMN